MPYNNYFPNGYNAYIPQYTYQPGQIQQNQTQTQMTPPTIHAEIVQVDSENDARNYPVAAGCTQMLMSKDDEHIYIKSAYANAPAQLIIYNKCAPAVETPPDYVTKEELEKRLNDVISKLKGNNQQQKRQEGVKNG